MNSWRRGVEILSDCEGSCVNSLSAGYVARVVDCSPATFCDLLTLLPLFILFWDRLLLMLTK